MKEDTLLKDKLLIGWSEWCALPDLGIPAIKAKIDTGAKTSAIHAFNIRTKRQGKQLVAYFDIHPIQRNNDITVSCRAKIIDERNITSSTGHKESRYVIETPIQLGNQTWNIELTLSKRDALMFRMLLGREALDKRVIIDPSQRLHQGQIKKHDLLKKYRS